MHSNDKNALWQTVRQQYQEAVFRSAYALTNNLTQAQGLTQVFFEQLSQEFQDGKLPESMDLYILSKMNYLYAKGWAAPSSPYQQPTKTCEPPQTSGGILLGQVVYHPTLELEQVVCAPSAVPQPPVIPKTEGPRPTVSQPPTAPQQAPAAASKPTVSEQPPAPMSAAPENAVIQAVFDPEITALWTPDIEGENPAQVSAILPPPKPQKARVTEKSASSIPLTITNTILVLLAIAAVVFLVTSL